MPRQPIFSVEQLMGSFQMWATAYMLKAFVDAKAKADQITAKQAAEQITEAWYQSQMDGLNAQLSAMTAGEFRMYQARNKIADIEDVRVEFRRVLEQANAEVMKMLCPPEKEQKP